MKHLTKLKALRGVMDAATRIASSLETMLAMAREERRKEADREAARAVGASWTVLVELRSGVVLVASGRGPQQAQVRFFDHVVGPKRVAWERKILATHGDAVANALGTMRGYAADPGRSPTSEELAVAIAQVTAECPLWNAIARVEVHGAVSVQGLRLDCQADILQQAPVPAFLVGRLASVWLEASDVVMHPGSALNVEIVSC